MTYRIELSFLSYALTKQVTRPKKIPVLPVAVRP